MLKAYDLWFESGTGLATFPGRPPTRERPSTPPDGWIGSAGPGIAPRTWPRGTLTGLPMFHALTLRLPAEYRRRGAGLTTVAFFQGEGQFAAARAEAPRTEGLARLVPRRTDPFEADVAAAEDHPHLARRTDIIDGQFALLWLTDEETAPGPVAPPPDARRDGEHVADDEGPNAWDTQEPTCAVWLLERPDPNAGTAPVDPMHAQQTAGYTSPYTSDFTLQPWVAGLAPCHLGGTSLPVQGLPDGLTPYYLEIEELPGLNFGGGSAQIDLESDAFDWACG